MLKKMFLFSIFLIGYSLQVYSSTTNQFYFQPENGKTRLYFNNRLLLNNTETENIFKEKNDIENLKKFRLGKILTITGRVFSYAGSFTTLCGVTAFLIPNGKFELINRELTQNEKTTLVLSGFGSMILGIILQNFGEKSTMDSFENFNLKNRIKISMSYNQIGLFYYF